MPTGYSKISDLNSLYNSIYEGAFVVERQGEMIPNLVTRLEANTMANRILPGVTATTAATVAEGDPPTSGTLAKTAAGTVTPVIVHHQIALTDERAMTDPDNAASLVAIEAGQALARYVDKAGVDTFANFTTSLGAGGSAMALTHVAAAMSILDQNVAPSLRYAVLAPYAWYDVYKQVTNVAANPITTTAGDLANQALRQFFVANMAGALWFTNANIGTSGTAGTVTNAVFAPTAIVYDERTPMRMEVERVPDRRATSFNFVMRFGYAVWRQTHGVKILSKASTPTA